MRLPDLVPNLVVGKSAHSRRWELDGLSGPFQTILFYDFIILWLILWNYELIYSVEEHIFHFTWSRSSETLYMSR